MTGVLTKAKGRVVLNFFLMMTGVLTVAPDSVAR